MGKYLTQEEVDDIIQRENLVLRNLQVTWGYYRISQGMRKVIGSSNINWTTFATHASRTAGQALRHELMPGLVKSAMIRMAREALSAGRETSLSAVVSNNPDALTPKAIYTEASNGDKVCLEIFDEAARFLAVAISDINNVLDIHNFIIGGGVSKASRIFEAGLLSEVKKNIFSVSRDKIRIIFSKLGNDAGIFGAGYLAKQSI